MKKINQRQNEDLSLSVQFMARYYFNRAEILNIVCWVLCLLSFLCLLLPNELPQLLICVIPLIIDVSAGVLDYCFNQSINYGSKFREIFDNYVFGFSNNLELDEELKEKMIKASKKHAVNLSIQKKNTALDNPPGVRNWYKTDIDLTDYDAIFTCQKENKKWEKRLFIWSILFRIVLFIGFVLFLLIIVSLKNVTLCQVILSSILLFRIFSRLWLNIKYFILNNSIDGVISTLEIEKSEKQIIYLQSKINEKRRMGVVGVNFIYKLLAKKITILENELNK